MKWCTFYPLYYVVYVVTYSIKVTDGKSLFVWVNLSKELNFPLFRSIYSVTYTIQNVNEFTDSFTLFASTTNEDFGHSFYPRVHC